ncbi:hypothetical protein [Tepidibacillus marianensis]|uniref:hypothetical protein n=1 Tax=Tepidibacillus marianensis TaxID=3131995 RepID=UPI0030D1E9F0
MSNQNQMNVNQQTLVNAWKDTLPDYLNDMDSAEVKAVNDLHNSLLVHIDTKGRQGYHFDFQVTYQDPREVQVNIVNVGTDGLVDDASGTIANELVEDYTRHIHECAQALQSITHP